MECIAVAASAVMRERWLLSIEDAGEKWRCHAVEDCGQALGLLARSPCDVVLLAEDKEGRQLLSALMQRPLTAPPWLVGDLWQEAGMDGHAASGWALASLVNGWESEGRLPMLAMARFPEMTCMSRSLLGSLDVSRNTRAAEYLPDMVALCTAHPGLMADLAHRLYPLTARRHAMTPAAVERSLRLTVESTWTRGSLTALERFFGHSVDPDRGKPTNKEFLARLQERMTLAMARMG